jgi:hypothetical protein
MGLGADEIAQAVRLSWGPGIDDIPVGPIIDQATP